MSNHDLPHRACPRPKCTRKVVGLRIYCCFDCHEAHDLEWTKKVHDSECDQRAEQIGEWTAVEADAMRAEVAAYRRRREEEDDLPVYWPRGERSMIPRLPPRDLGRIVADALGGGTDGGGTGDDPLHSSM